MKAGLRNEDVDLSVLPGQVPFPGIPECNLRRQKRSRSKLRLCVSSVVIKSPLPVTMLEDLQCTLAELLIIKREKRSLALCTS